MKKTDIYILFIVFLIFLLSIPNIFKYKSFDLTKDKKFTISNTTISNIKKIKSPLKIDILLEGSMPNYYYPFQNQIKEMVKLFVNENELISYNFIDPYKLNQKNLFLKKISDFFNTTLPKFPLILVKFQTDFQKNLGLSTDHFQILLKSFFELNLYFFLIKFEYRLKFVFDNFLLLIFQLKFCI